jgi:glycosyltransferase involved in cell wall biosynthesis
LKSDMKILHMDTNDIAGGAAIAAFRLHTGLKNIGIDSKMFVASKGSHDASVLNFNAPTTIFSRFLRYYRRSIINQRMKRYARTRPIGLEVFSDDQTQYSNTLFDQFPVADLINLHWISGFLDLSEFFSWVNVPVVWTLHDMNPFTGGCHYNVNCDQYVEKCGHCPQLGSTKDNDLSRRIWCRKQRAFSRVAPHLHLVAPSRWIANEAKRSELFNKIPISIIPNSIDTNMFIPRTKNVCREALGIPNNSRVLLFMAQSIENNRKGFVYLIEAFSEMKGHENIQLVSIGNGKLAIPSSIPCLHIGSINNELMLSIVINAADLFAITSLQDNLPNTVLEAMACGVPVIGFKTGGIPDMVRENETGFLVPVGDVRTLREAIICLLGDDVKREAIGVNCRKIVEQEYKQNIQAKRYVALYDEILSNSRA